MRDKNAYRILMDKLKGKGHFEKWRVGGVKGFI